MTISKAGIISEVICSTQKRRRRTPYEKHQIVQETYHPGVTISFIAQKHGIPPSQLFYWRRLLEISAMTGVNLKKKLFRKAK